MKILAIRLKNLASLAGPVDIDFTAEPLASAGLFAITGPTGAGKSTLLDALCLALFNEALQAHAIAGDERLHHALGERLARTLQFAKDDARRARVLGYEGDMRHEHGPQCAQGRGHTFGRAVDTR